MKKYLCVTFAAILISASAYGGGGMLMQIGGGVAAVGGAACSTVCGSGDIRNGDNESFENQFCRSNMSEIADTGNVINFTASDYHSGAYSLEITLDSDTSGESFAGATFASGDNSFTSIFFFKCPNISAFKVWYPLVFENSSYAAHFRVRLRDWGSGEELYIYNGSAYSTNYFVLTPGNWYAVSIIYNGTGTGDSDCKVWDVVGAGWMLNNGSSNYNITVASVSNDVLRYKFWDSYDDATAIVGLIDDFSVDLAGTAHPSTPCGE